MPRLSSAQRSRTRDRTAEHWLLLIGVTVVFAIVSGILDPARWHRNLVTAVDQPKLTMAEARRSNEAVPIVGKLRMKATPFLFHGGPASLAQATDCLATAALYEAGSNRREQKAVMQVVLNRVGLPGYPKPVCGVVYQGADRQIGCQFSFACDGSLARRPEHRGWDAARRAARRALGGYVFADIGRATNYHTDWMVPYWRSSLVKTARVNTHLFYVRPQSAGAWNTRVLVQK